MGLPGLDTTNISLVAFWNALDNGASEIDPQETTGVFDTYESYSNGVEGTVTVQPDGNQGYTAHARVKDDGWIIAWIDRTPLNEFTIGDIPSEVGGRIRVINDYADSYAYVPDNGDTTHLERIIYSLTQELSNSGSFTYSSTDVALYDYEYPDASGIHHLGHYNQNGTLFSHTLEATSDTTVYTAPIHAYGQSGTENSYVKWDPDGANILLVDNFAEDVHGTREIAGRGEFGGGDSKTLEYHSGYNKRVNWTGLFVWG